MAPDRMSTDGPVPPGPTARLRPARLVPLALIVLAGAAVIEVAWYENLSAAALLERRAAIGAFVSQHRVVALLGFMGIYTAVVALSIPGATLLTICGGIVFGGLEAALAALVGATAGATVIFLIARSALGGWLVRRAGPRVETVAAGFCSDAFNYLLFLRLVPLFPFCLVNLVAALCGVRLRSFVLATALGIIPATFAFAFFGAGLGSAVTAQLNAYRACVAAGRAGCRLGLDPSAAATPQLIAGLVALGVLALVPVVVRRVRAARAPRELSSDR
jgi:uncharacterized membrane protein YdjX (TVP38/TMEM64 family)